MEDAEDGERIMPCRFGDGDAIDANPLPAVGDAWPIDPDLLDGAPYDELDETENADVRQVVGEREAEMSHGEEEVAEGADDETVEDMEPFELCRLPALPRPVFSIASFPGRIRHS